MTRPALLIFTDLDGTLLDHETYSHAEAAPALRALRAAGVPVILASSKTAAEIAPLRTELGLSAYPAIVENGAGRLEPDAEAPRTGGRYRALRSALSQVPAPLRSRFKGFGDGGTEWIAEVTGLAPEAAALAARRLYSEPGIWSGSETEKSAFLAALQAQGVSGREGGRFLTLSFGASKAGQMAEIAARYTTPFVVALGDAPNDREMLEQADQGFIIANPHRAPMPPLAGEETGRIQRIAAAGPKGWNLALRQVISDFGI
ncbi:mannosyl-3-phosphoglycerate phosphatase [Rhodovulum sp. MB263]|uniref:HAD-IIB family hydrolase n=1 Tax=Rhodovulum sp. (strain MB263) TaxID=308754 RepID=UPI0009B7CC25|nr:HAD hydrolase family protein [Rhodovulum sp. MB263]ARC89872.1 mannosyl-3-phosphoglycerate phosphatase [Rhodovulum sp. MB263]